MMVDWLLCVCRGNRATKKVQMAQDFMDNEDGLLGGVLATKEVINGSIKKWNVMIKSF